MNTNCYKSKFIQQHAHNRARCMHVSTPHGEIQTPTFMPVGTHAAVNCMTPADLLGTGTQIILGGNTYHMLCNPGLETIEKAGGMHQFMAWDLPMLTDSGGFQVMSLSRTNKIDDNGALFTHPRTGQLLQLTPKLSFEAQRIIGADIIMAFDQCCSDDDKSLMNKAMNRTHRWLEQIKSYHDKTPQSKYGSRQALFGIIQGGVYPYLREESVKFVVSMQTEGIALGGETIGFNMEMTGQVIDWIHPYLPTDKVLYTMGVGLKPQDLIDVIAGGVDIFDCVAPTRNARHGSLYSGKIVPTTDRWIKFDSEYKNACLQIKRGCFADDTNPIMDDCSCFTCQHYSRAYLHFLCKQKSIAFSTLACIHNVHVMQTICKTIRDIILK